MSTKSAVGLTNDLLDNQLLNLIQSNFPLVKRPYAEMARELGATEEQVMDRLSHLKKSNVVRQVGAIFDTRRLGYKTCLVAFRYKPELLDKGARRVNQHPGVSHNYERNGYFNLWFTIAVAPNESLEDVIEQMASETEAEACRIMPTIRFFKIGVNFDMVKKEGAAYEYFSPDGFGTPGSKQDATEDSGANWNKPVAIDQRDVEFIRELQEDLPIVSSPFEGIARRLGVEITDLFNWAGEAVQRGFMRRYSAVLNHRRAGFRANAMVVWKVPPERSIDVGMIMAQSPWITHCYERPTFPDWPYSHFSMIHATTRSQCMKVAKTIASETGIEDYQLLYSTREYKKTRVRYFVEHEYEGSR